MQHTPVLIAGGGVVGLSASLFLAHHGVRSILVERHPGTSIYPRARGVNGRTMELMRELGLDRAIQHAGADLAPAIGMYRGTTLVDVLQTHGRGNWLMRKMRARAGRGTGSRHSPAGPCRCTQEAMEPLLLDAARARGVDVRFATELTAFDQDATGVTATLVDRGSGEPHVVRADYAIAADGARSRIAERLGIARTGESQAGHQLNLYVRADLAALVKGREFSICLIDNPDVRGLLVSINNADLWVLHVAYDPARGERPEDFPPERCAQLVRKATGIADLAVTVKAVNPWQSAVRIAESFQRGRIFLAGDAAHTMPPWGGFGANTGIQDAHNLAWKLALVLAGTAGSELLATYETERMPIARAVSALAAGMSDPRGLLDITPGLGMLWRMRKVFPYFTMGYGYASPAVALEPGPPPGPGSTDLRGRPGTRAPHSWLTHDARLSTLDRLGKRFVLFAGRDGDAWCTAARDAAGRLGIAIDTFRIGVDLGEPGTPERRFRAAYGLTPAGAALVRPDGIVAWRARRAGGSPGDSLFSVLTKILRPPSNPKAAINPTDIVPAQEARSG